jgi:heat shock protein HtpX
VSFAVVPDHSHILAPQVSSFGTTAILDFHLPIRQPGAVLRCRVEASPQEVSRLQRHLHRALNHRHSGWAMAGMVMLLTVCGWVVGGEEGARLAVAGSTPPPGGAPISAAAMQQLFGARLLRYAELPAVFDVLHDICRRARLRRVPVLYCLPAPHSMNAYAFGGPDGSAITLTEGLLRGMTLGEIAGILAHEVAHIRNHDAWAMSWAAALQRAISLTSFIGLMSLQARPDRAAVGQPLAAVLANAPAIGQLLGLALSRIRELDADALALDLIDDSRALIAALDKLERHHTGARVAPPAACEEDPRRFLRSHPATSERVGTLLRLAS